MPPSPSSSGTRFLATLFLCASIFGGCALISQSIRTSMVSHKHLKIQANGEKKITADSAVLSLTLTTQHADRAQAHVQLDQDKKRVFNFLEGEDIKPEMITSQAITQHEISLSGASAVEVRQQFLITASDVHRIAALSTKISQLTMEGLHITASSPLYTCSADLQSQTKMDLLLLCHEDAALQVNQFTALNDVKVGSFVSAESLPISDGAPASSLEKTIKMAMAITYEVK